MNKEFEITHLLTSIEKYKSKKSIGNIFKKNKYSKNKNLIKMYLELCNLYYIDFQYNNVIKYSLKSLRICEKYYNNFFYIKIFLKMIMDSYDKLFDKINLLKYSKILINYSNKNKCYKSTIETMLFIADKISEKKIYYYEESYYYSIIHNQQKLKLKILKMIINYYLDLNQYNKILLFLSDYTLDIESNEYKFKEYKIYTYLLLNNIENAKKYYDNKYPKSTNNIIYNFINDFICYYENKDIKNMDIMIDYKIKSEKTIDLIEIKMINYIRNSFQN